VISDARLGALFEADNITAEQALDASVYANYATAFTSIGPAWARTTDDLRRRERLTHWQAHREVL